VIDLDLKNLPVSIDEIEIKKQAKVKHVISATLDVDKLTNECSGTGRIKMRLGPNENLDSVK